MLEKNSAEQAWKRGHRGSLGTASDKVHHMPVAAKYAQGLRGWSAEVSPFVAFHSFGELIAFSS